MYDEPIAFGTVELAAVAAEESQIEATDEQGRFEFPCVPPGRFHLRAEGVEKRLTISKKALKEHPLPRITWVKLDKVLRVLDLEKITFDAALDAFGLSYDEAKLFAKVLRLMTTKRKVFEYLKMTKAQKQRFTQCYKLIPIKKDRTKRFVRRTGKASASTKKTKTTRGKWAK